MRLTNVGAHADVRAPYNPKERFCCRSAADGGMFNHWLNVLLQRGGAAVALATPAGFEPATTRLEGECSIQLSYGVDGWASAALSHPAPRSAIVGCGVAQRLAAHPIVAEIVGVALRLLGLLMRRDDGVIE